jgi:hypothetical protein
MYEKQIIDALARRVAQLEGHLGTLRGKMRLMKSENDHLFTNVKRLEMGLAKEGDDTHAEVIDASR